jgi:hypothetical protein
MYRFLQHTLRLEICNVLFYCHIRPGILYNSQFRQQSLNEPMLQQHSFGYEVPGVFFFFFGRNVKVVMGLDHSRDLICTCFNLHQLRFKRINASCAEVAALLRRLCFYVSSRKRVIGFRAKSQH